MTPATFALMLALSALAWCYGLPLVALVYAVGAVGVGHIEGIAE